ncbi:uncharacterized protein PV06_11576 [Exophiala oligosperma]|uniref:Uncharacterized protein n=2 Tax=leotiomyceta TaxID=716546 RepID=A0A0D2A726_9EURO|nr:uncharacterized protein PV06_11576 [Exophiala oligosperma]KIW36126.1 hypothetical protein PV06_11576 [Exophiala oligosperma]
MARTILPVAWGSLATRMCWSCGIPRKDLGNFLDRASPSLLVKSHGARDAFARGGFGCNNVHLLHGRGEPLLSVDEDYLGAVQRPVDSAAQILSEAYFHALQGVFGFITREQFLQDLAQFPAQGILLSWDQRRWLALANLVWAIGSKWSHVAKLDDQDLHAKSHLVYYARARALGLDHRVLFDHPNGEGVQAIGLLSFYWFQNGSISRFNADFDLI